MMKIRGTETEGVRKIWKNFTSQRVILNCDHFLECNCQTSQRTLYITHGLMCEIGGDGLCFTLCSVMGLFGHPDYGGTCCLHVLNSGST